MASQDFQMQFAMMFSSNPEGTMAEYNEKKANEQLEELNKLRKAVEEAEETLRISEAKRNEVGLKLRNAFGQHRREIKADYFTASLDVAIDRETLQKAQSRLFFMTDTNQS